MVFEILNKVSQSMFMPHISILFGIIRFLIRLCITVFCLPFYNPMRGLSLLRSIYNYLSYKYDSVVYFYFFSILFHFLVSSKRILRKTNLTKNHLVSSFWFLIRSICDVIRRWSESGNNVTAASSSSKLMPFDKSFICQWEGTHFWLTSRDSKVFGVWNFGAWV